MHSGICGLALRVHGVRDVPVSIIDCDVAVPDAGGATNDALPTFPGKLDCTRFILIAIFSPAAYPTFPFACFRLKYLKSVSHAADSDDFPVSERRDFVSIESTTP
jgi:hypothetical protein